MSESSGGGATSSPQMTLFNTLKAELRISDDVQDVLLRSCLTRSTSLVELFIDRPLFVNDYVERHVVTKRPCLSIFLRRYPLVSVSSISINDVKMTPLEGGKFAFDADAGEVYPPLGAVWRCGNVIVSYRAGYAPNDAEVSDAPPLPAAISQAILVTARSLFHAPGRGDPALRSESIQGVGSTSWLDPSPENGGLPAEAAAALERFQGVYVA